ncbi:Oligosaccharyl transferase alpha subunit, partial [Rhodotorula sp. JG-1b]
SAWAPASVSSTIQLGGSLTRSSAVYSLEKRDSSHGDSHRWTTAVNGAHQGGWVEATTGKGAAKRKIQMLPAAAVDGDLTLYSLDLAPESDSGATSLAVTVSSVQSHQTVPFPAKLAQNAESVYLLWKGDLLAPIAGLSADQRRHVKEIKVRVKTPTPRIVAYETPKGFEAHQQTGSATLTFTSKPGVDLSTLSEQIASVHFQQPEAVAAIRKLDRIVELSHWGNNLAIQDTIDLFNAGPELDGQFARIDFQKASMMRRQGITAIPSLSLSLPASATSPYFYDLVGNVSTSNFRSSSASSYGVLPSQRQKKRNSHVPAVLELKPRYPILGGWNYSFTIGYDLPLGEFVRTRAEKGSGKYLAAVPFLTPIKDVAIDAVRVEIRLPEGARDIHVHTPFPMSTISYPAFIPRLFGKHHTVQQGGAVSWTYLDSTGRPTVVLTKEGCTDMHGGDVLIEYTLPFYVDWFQKPIACASVLASLFVAIAIAKRV